ncbi:unnamed protein product [Litomosoides sigmodontis]|uniref:Uncharacterized protein n=1 Tax=Litomosoides sigmodontis TaxID=42156 RepID=A0A3P6TZE6_LITSI|nr:unnamed protein product [Litomosoides sigmodontis]
MGEIRWRTWNGQFPPISRTKSERDHSPTASVSISVDQAVPDVPDVHDESLLIMSRRSDHKFSSTQTSLISPGSLLTNSI